MIQPSDRARYRAFWSTTGPRDVLTSTADGFIERSRSSLTRWRVSAVRFVCSDTKSDRAKSIVERRRARRRVSLGHAGGRVHHVVEQHASCRTRAPGAPPPGRSARTRRSRSWRPRRRCRAAAAAPTSSSAGAHVAIALGDAPASRHQQREGEVGGRVGQHPRRVADRLPAGPSPRGRRCCRSRPRSCSRP